MVPTIQQNLRRVLFILWLSMEKCHVSAVVVADDEFQNLLNVVIPYSRLNLPREKDAFNFYHSSCLMTFEQVFGMLVTR